MREEIVDSDDVGVGDVLDQVHFLLKIGEQLRFGGGSGSDDLESDGVAGENGECLENLPVSPGSNEFLYSIKRQICFHSLVF